MIFCLDFSDFLHIFSLHLVIEEFFFRIFFVYVFVWVQNIYCIRYLE
jgi:hypothetical protein